MTMIYVDLNVYPAIILGERLHVHVHAWVVVVVGKMLILYNVHVGGHGLTVQHFEKDWKGCSISSEDTHMLE